MRTALSAGPLRQGAIAACLVVAFLVACGSQRPPELGNTAPGSGTFAGPCPAEGATRACDQVIAQHAGYVDCFYGTQTCVNGSWTPCQGDGSGATVSTKGYSGPAVGSSGGGDLALQSLSDASTSGAPCNVDPCDPYCVGFSENPPVAISPSPNPQACGMTATGTNVGCSGGTAKDVGIGSCTTDADCQMDWHCDTSAGKCVWNDGSGYFDPTCVDGSGQPGIDLTLGVPCHDPNGSYNIPVCNRGGGTLPTGSVVTLENDGNGGHSSWDCATQANPTVSAGSRNCTYTLSAPLGAGQCVIVNTLTTPGCDALEQGERYLFVNWDKSITECGTGFPAPAGTGIGCMNNVSHTKATGKSCPPACGAPPPTTYTQLYTANCALGTVPQWNLLSFNVTTSGGADVKFGVQTGPSPTGPWLQPTPLQVADAPVDHPDVCSMTGPSPCGGSYAATCTCPVDIYTPLGKLNARQPYLLLTTNFPGTGACALATPVINLYAHSSSTLYSVDPATYAITTIGDFQDTNGNAITAMTDIALDQNNNMYGVTFTDLYQINYSGNPVVCTQLGGLSTSYNGLTFVPSSLMGTPNDVLVGNALDGGWWQINLAPVSETLIGYYGGGPGVIGSAGDSVGITGDRVYATATGLGASDHLITVDPKTGAMSADLGSTGQTGLWGLGYWSGKAYAFSSAGEIFTIDLTTGVVTQVSTGDPSWWGAAVTTNVNVNATPPSGSSALNSWQLSYDCVPAE
jgi:hypothetical protein